MAFQVFTPIFNKIDAVTATFVTDISSKIIAEITPLVVSGLTLSFILYGLLIIRGTVEMPVMDFLGRAVRIAIITGVALAGGLYQSQIAEAIVKTPDELASALVSGASQDKGVAFLLDQTAEIGLSAAGDAFDKSSFFTDLGTIYGAFGIIVLLVTCILVAIGAAFILIAKIALALLAGLGPLFIVALLFQATHRFFEMWSSQILNYALLIVIFPSIFGLMMNIFSSYMGDIDFDGVKNFSYTLGGAVIISNIMIILLLQLPSIATGLAGGISTSLIYEQRIVKGMIGSMIGRRGKRNSRGKKVQDRHHADEKERELDHGANKTYGYFKGGK